MTRKKIAMQVRNDLDKFKKIGRGKLQQASREILLEVGRRLVDYSPVGDPTRWHPPRWPRGYIPGHFKNNWQVGIDTKPVGVISTVDPTGKGSLERLKHLGRWTLGHTYYFGNNLPYAYKLEIGWSSQAPQGMVARVKREYKQIVQEVVARVRKEDISTEE